MAVDVQGVPASDNSIEAVRRFNRFYTRQIGVLQEHLLESQLSLTEVRVLYELAHRERLTAIDLRRELGIDRGYLSRMLQKFEKHGWIKTKPSPEDRRRIFLALTTKGRRVFDPLDSRSGEEVAAMLAKLSPSAQAQMLGAMREIEGVLGGGEMPVRLSSSGRPLRAGSVAPQDSALAKANLAKHDYILRQHRPGDMGWVVQRHGELYWREYRYDERFEALVAGIVAEFVQNLVPERERCWIAEKEGVRVGAIFLVKKSATVAKLRLLLVEPGARGLGIGKRLVSECVNFARKAGYKKILLWTQSELHAARHLYEQAGFKRIAQEPHQSWGRTDLVAETWELTL
jgi:DNA-binding MarR family transcriptional regulator/GNAT superfamily N-acetyltransferase